MRVCMSDERGWKQGGMYELNNGSFSFEEEQLLANVAYHQKEPNQRCKRFTT